MNNRLLSLQQELDEVKQSSMRSRRKSGAIAQSLSQTEYSQPFGFDTVQIVTPKGDVFLHPFETQTGKDSLLTGIESKLKGSRYKVPPGSEIRVDFQQHIIKNGKVYYKCILQGKSGYINGAHISVRNNEQLLEKYINESDPRLYTGRLSADPQFNEFLDRTGYDDNFLFLRHMKILRDILSDNNWDTAISEINRIVSIFRDRDVFVLKDIEPASRQSILDSHRDLLYAMGMPGTNWRVAIEPLINELKTVESQFKTVLCRLLQSFGRDQKRRPAGLPGQRDLEDLPLAGPPPTQREVDDRRAIINAQRALAPPALDGDNEWAPREREPSQSDLEPEEPYSAESSMAMGGGSKPPAPNRPPPPRPIPVEDKDVKRRTRAVGLPAIPGLYDEAMAAVWANMLDALSRVDRAIVQRQSLNDVLWGREAQNRAAKAALIQEMLRGHSEENINFYYAASHGGRTFEEQVGIFHDFIGNNLVNLGEAGGPIAERIVQKLGGETKIQEYKLDFG